MATNKYGTRAWMESQYASTSSDPWGLDWRPSQQFRYVKMLEALKQSLDGVPRRLSIIDVGCATGYFTAMLVGLQNQSEGGTLIGFDIAQSAVGHAAERYPYIRFECMEMAECATKFAGSADIVTCMEVLYYLPQEQRAQATQYLKSLLKPGGILLVSSMVAIPPYFSETELATKLSIQVSVVTTGVLYLKPLVIFEKLLMKIGGNLCRRWVKTCYGMVRGMEHALERVSPRIARSLAYVIAYND